MKNSKSATAHIKLPVRGRPFELQAAVPIKPVRPQRMLPVFQKMTNLFVGIGIKESEAEGREISCQKGCTACCHQLVPLPEFEAYHIAELVEKMPEPRRTEMKRRFGQTVAHFTETGWVEKFDNITEYNQEEWREMLSDYFTERIACPFLVDDACSIYHDRPLVCREYLVTSPAENCSNPTPENINPVEIPIEPSKKLFKFGQKNELREMNFVPLFMSLDWSSKNPPNFPKKTGEKWLGEFLQSIVGGEKPKSAAGEKPKDADFATGSINLTVRGKPLEVEVTVPTKPVKPQRMLPVFQKMTNLFVEIGVKESEAEGQDVSCQKGCGACCRQPVPLPEFEAYHIAELVEKMPEPQRSSVRMRFDKAVAHLTEIGWVDRFENCADSSEEQRTAMFLDYFREGIACPFLVDESCSIHQNRPLACREYLVTNPPENCSNPTPQNINLIKIPVAPSKNLFKFGQKNPLPGLNVVPLIMSLKQAGEKPNDFQQKTGEQWMGEFLQSVLTSAAPKDSETI